MLYGWKHRISITPETIAERIAVPFYRLVNRSGLRLEDIKGKLPANSSWPSGVALHPGDVGELAQAWNLTVVQPASFSIDELCHMLRGFGPLWVGLNLSHAIVVTGLRSDGAPENTTFYVNDPWPPGKGAETTLSFDEFVRGYPAGPVVTGTVLDPQDQRAFTPWMLHAGGRTEPKKGPPRPYLAGRGR